MRRYLYFLFLLLFFSTSTFATTYNWVGGIFNTANWDNASNWVVASTNASNGSYPGAAAGDIAQIGVAGYSSPQPTITTTMPFSLGGIVFGPNLNILSASNAITLTVNTGVILTVTGNITQMHSNNNTAATTTITGAGTIICQGTFNVGDATAPAAPALLVGINTSNATTVNVSVPSFTTANLTLNSTSVTGSYSSNTSSNVNNPILNITGNVYVGSILQLSHSAYVNTSGFTVGFIITTTYPAAVNSATINSNGNLTLLSDSTGSAAVAPIPIGASIVGNVNVQRFVKGSFTNLSKRGYILISSPVNTANLSGLRVFDLLYLKNNTFVSGAGGVSGGFDATPTNNPSLYLYREDIGSATTGFTTGNYKGIAKINKANHYDIGTQKKLTKTNTADTTINLPIGNGVLFFFRGNRLDNSTQSGTKLVAPFDFPESVVFTQIGLLNTGTVKLQLWYRSTNLLSYTNTGLANAAISGYSLVGNPYASTINWEKFNRNSTMANSSIYGGNFPNPTTSPSTIWFYNPTNKQYETYMQKSGTISTADTTTNINPGIAVGAASNMIASGQGFFIRASSTTQSLTFTESAKTTTQPASAGLNKLMGIPKTSVSTPLPLLRFQMIQDTINYDEVVLAFNNNASTKFVANEDAEDIGGNGALVSLSTLTSDSVYAAINQMPMPQKTPQVTSLFVYATSSGRYSLKLTEKSNMPTIYQVWLRDNYLRDSLDIGNNTTYQFNIDNTIPASFGSGRFQVIVSENPAIGLHLLDFAAVNPANTTFVNTTWKVENESNYTTFYVQRSNDNGNTYQSIGSLQSDGSGSYSFVDKNPGTGQLTYRLELNDLNNIITYSNPITIMFANLSNSAIATSNINIYPNPVAGIVNLKMTQTNGATSSYTVTIANTSGNIIKTIVSPQPYWSEDVSALIPGMYLMKVVDNKDKSVVGTGKFLKQ